MQTSTRRLVASIGVSCALHAALLVTLPLGQPVGVAGGSRADTSALRIFLAKQGARLTDVGVAAGRSDGAVALPSRQPATGEAAAIGIPHAPPELIYWAPGELDAHPRSLESVDPALPAEADAVASGKIRLLLFIDAEGHVRRVLVESSDLRPVFAEAAAEAFRRTRFSPGKVGGQAVASWMRVEVSYGYQRIASDQPIPVAAQETR